MKACRVHSLILYGIAVALSPHQSRSKPSLAVRCTPVCCYHCCHYCSLLLSAVVTATADLATPATAAKIACAALFHTQALVLCVEHTAAAAAAAVAAVQCHKAHRCKLQA
jgi:hypothetical protein